MKQEDAEAHLASLFASGFEEVAPDAAFMAKVHRQARALGTSVYDTCYFVLAKQRNALMVTADLKFDLRARSKHVATLDKVYRELR